MKQLFRLFFVDVYRIDPFAKAISQQLNSRTMDLCTNFRPKHSFHISRHVRAEPLGCHVTKMC